MIDQTTYFRNVAFARLDWQAARQQPYREDAWGDFDITILGEHYGPRRLKISYKPSGEAGQHNYTSILHWGDLGDLVRRLNLRGRTFSLYSPPEGQVGPFFIEIQ